MKTFLAVARREILEKRFVLAAAAVASAIPILIPIVRQLPAGAARETRDFAAFMLSMGLSAAIAAGLGASIFAGDLAAKRMGFFFSRPISSVELWAGKLAGAIFLIGASFGMILGLASLVDRGRAIPGELAIGLPILSASILAVLFGSNVLATIFRSRSGVAVVDLALSAAVTLLSVWTVSRLRAAGFEAPAPVWWAAGVVVGAALVLSSYRAVARGRTDIRIAHASLSAVLWGILGTAAAGFAVYSSWALNAPPSALSRIDMAFPVGDRGWVAVEGRARGLDAAYLYDARSARHQRVRTEVLEATPDGRLAAWLVPETANGPRTVHTLRLDDPSARARETKIVLSRRTWPLILSADGSRLAAVSGRLLAVYEVESGRLLASVQVRDKDEGISGAFVSPDVLRILRIRPGAIPGRARREVLELDVAAKKIETVGASDGLLSAAPVLRSRDRDQIVMNEGRGSRVTIRDARTLQIRSTLREGEPARSSTVAILSDEKIVLGLSDDRSAWLQTFSPDGAPLNRVPLGPTGRIRLGGETARDQLLVAVHLPSGGPGLPERHVLHLVDLSNGTATKVADGLRPLIWWWHPQRIAPGSEPTKLFLSDDQKLVRFDPSTGERRVLFGAP